MRKPGMHEFYYTAVWYMFGSVEFSCLSLNGVTTETPSGQNNVSQPGQANHQPQQHDTG